MIAANPALITSLGTSVTTALRRDYRAILRAAIDAERSFPAELAALRLQWAELIAEIGALDVFKRTFNLRNQPFANGTGDREHERRLSHCAS